VSDQPPAWDDVDPLVAWIVAIDGVVPPFCLEVVLADGSRYSFHSVIFHDERANLATFRIWDFRSLSDEELDELRTKVMKLEDASALGEVTALHRKLEYADVRLRLADVAHVVESHAPLWPAAQGNARTPSSRAIGFGT
jgi:hypothetical protein